MWETVDDGLSDEQRAANERRINTLNALGMALCAKRRDAMAARTASGIEDEWLGDEEFYAGFDDANRDEFAKTAVKPAASGVSREDVPKAKGSTIFPNITQPYVDAAAARVGDMLLPTDDRNFDIEPTPIPDIFEILAKEAEASLQENAESPAPIQLPNGNVIHPTKMVDAFAEMKAEAARKCEKARERIDDWLSECQYHGEVRKIIDDAARLGSGVIKGPVPISVRSRQWRKGDDGIRVLAILDEIKPGSRRIDPWNLFPDGACGESIHNGGFIWERDFITAKRLAETKRLPGYIADQVDLCIEEGPKSATGHNSEAASRDIKGQYEIWYYHGDVTREELESAGVDVGDSGRDSYPAMITLVNDRVVRAALNPLDTGAFPYDVIPWKRRPNMPWGMGVARQMRPAQRIVTAATRNLMDNAGMGAGPQIVIRRGVEPQDGSYDLYPRKIWIETDDSDGQAGSPMMAVIIPMLQVELMNIIQMGMKMAEDTTGLPALLQGQLGAAPDTVGGMTILNNNANSVLRRISRLFDTCITEPHIRRYYDWLMEYGEDDDEKGDFRIVARGSTALVERDIQSQEMMNVVNMCLNPAFGKNPEKAMDEYLKSRRFEPKAFDFSDEEKAEKQNAPQAPPVQIAVAQIREQGQTERKSIELQSEQQEKALDRAFEKWQTEVEATLRQAELEGAKGMNLDDLRTRLAETSLELRTQMQLAGARGPQVATPPTEPPGRAPNGMAYQR